MTKDRLIIFQKNPVVGKVKTRLSQDIGDEAALSVYMLMLEMTAEVVSNSSSYPAVYYSDFIDENDIWTNIPCEKFIQQGIDLGERMSNAFHDQALGNSDKVVIIGTDCPDITIDLIQESFRMLDENDFSIGPSRDGGYYLLGMRSFVPDVLKMCHGVLKRYLVRP